MRTVMAVVALAVFGVGAAQGETWNLREHDGKWTYRLTLTPGVPGPCIGRETSTGRELTRTCTIVRFGSSVFIKRVMDNGHFCIGHGEQTGNTISGTDACTFGPSGPGGYNWTATVTP
jgi:hypothetical protein